MKINQLLVVIILMVFTNPSDAEDIPETAEDIPGVAEDIEVRLYEMKKIGTVHITLAKLESSPDWDGKDFKTIPVPMEKAVDIAKNFLRINNCKVEDYLLKECLLVREGTDKKDKKWYWKITFVDDTIPMLNYPPLVTIPVLFTGEIPKVSFRPLKDNK